MPKLLPPLLFFALIVPILALPVIDLDMFINMHKTGIPYGEIGICSAIGLILLIGARVQFRNADAEINTFKNPRNLVTGGLFRISRNPMYLGFLALLIATALYVNIWQAMIAPAVFFLAAHYWYIPIEEDNALAGFGEPYRHYMNRVRRWI